MGKIDLTELVMRYKLGESDRTIAKQFSTSQSAVSQQRYKLGLKSNYQYPYWKGKNLVRINIKVDVNWKLHSYFYNTDKDWYVHIWTNDSEFKARVAVIVGDKSLWLDCYDMAHAEHTQSVITTELEKYPSIDHINQLLSERSDLGEVV